MNRKKLRELVHSASFILPAGRTFSTSPTSASDSSSTQIPLLTVWSRAWDGETFPSSETYQHAHLSDFRVRQEGKLLLQHAETLGLVSLCSFDCNRFAALWSLYGKEIAELHGPQKERWLSRASLRAHFALHRSASNKGTSAHHLQAQPTLRHRGSFHANPGNPRRYRTRTWQQRNIFRIVQRSRRQNTLQALQSAQCIDLLAVLLERWHNSRPVLSQHHSWTLRFILCLG